METCAIFVQANPGSNEPLKRACLPHHQYSDHEALHALLEGREDGLDHFFQAYYSHLTYFAYKLVHDEFLAEEIAAEAFVKLWNNRDRLSMEGSIKAWLYNTVRNASIDHLRKVKRLRVAESGLQTTETIEASVLQKLIETETIRQVIVTLDYLPPKCREVFRMFHFEGKSYQEIARELNISPHTVRNQKERATRLLKKKINLLSMIILFIAILH
ncbi:MAG TPA: RNA polymerase sigma-70 factor [Flavisolibacter sp.]|nr:RNA polymerase sigma-70 factor [Flavisolibacter sp.]